MVGHERNENLGRVLMQIGHVDRDVFACGYRFTCDTDRVDMLTTLVDTLPCGHGILCIIRAGCPWKFGKKNSSGKQWYECAVWCDRSLEAQVLKSMYRAGLEDDDIARLGWCIVRPSRLNSLSGLCMLKEFKPQVNS